MRKLEFHDLNAFYLFASQVRLIVTFLLNLAFSLPVAELAGDIRQKGQSGLIWSTSGVDVLDGLFSRSNLFKRFNIIFFHINSPLSNLHLNFDRIGFRARQCFSDNIGGLCYFPFFGFSFILCLIRVKWQRIFFVPRKLYINTVMSQTRRAKTRFNADLTYSIGQNPLVNSYYSYPCLQCHCYLLSEQVEGIHILEGRGWRTSVKNPEAIMIKQLRTWCLHQPKVCYIRHFHWHLNHRDVYLEFSSIGICEIISDFSSWNHKLWVLVYILLPGSKHRHTWMAWLNLLLPSVWKNLCSLSFCYRSYLKTNDRIKSQMQIMNWHINLSVHVSFLKQLAKIISHAYCKLCTCFCINLQDCKSCLLKFSASNNLSPAPYFQSVSSHHGCIYLSFFFIFVPLLKLEWGPFLYASH